MGEKRALPQEKRELVPVYGGDERLNFLQQFFYDMELAWRLFWDKRVSFLYKLVPLAWIAYMLSPLDISPDVLPVLGQLDDITLFVLAIKLFISLAPRGVVDEYLLRMGLLRPAEEDEIILEGEVRDITPEEQADKDAAADQADKDAAAEN